MKTRSVNEVKEDMSFPFCAPKEDNEVEENDEKFFLENMRSCSVNEAEEEKLYVLERKKKKNIFVSIGSTFFDF